MGSVTVTVAAAMASTDGQAMTITKRMASHALPKKFVTFNRDKWWMPSVPLRGPAPIGRETRDVPDTYQISTFTDTHNLRPSWLFTNVLLYMSGAVAEVRYGW